MGANLPLLLQPTCPVAGDIGISNFLHLVQALVPTGRVELVLEPEGGAEKRRYCAGDGSKASATVRIDAGSDFKATLRLGSETELGEEQASLLSAALKATLERHRLIAQTSLLRAALDTTSSSILLFDGRGDIVYANPPADALLSLQTEDELLAEIDGEPRRPLFSLLGTLIQRVTSSPGLTAVWKGRVRIADGRILACEVTRLPPQEMRADAVVVLLQPIGGETEVMVGTFSSHYNLSRREHEVLELLFEGSTTAAIADRLGISPHTVRDHLKNLYRKTGTGSRSDLLGLLSRADLG
jgi:DNA-binding CsgD family transcriptional regulator